jgi:hypothetical protein
MALSGLKDIRMLQRYSHTNEEAKKNALMKIDTSLSLFDKDDLKKEFVLRDVHNVQEL